MLVLYKRTIFTKIVKTATCYHALQVYKMTISSKFLNLSTNAVTNSVYILVSALPYASCLSCGVNTVPHSLPRLISLRLYSNSLRRFALQIQVSELRRLP